MDQRSKYREVHERLVAEEAAETLRSEQSAIRVRDEVNRLEPDERRTLLGWFRKRS